jgi:hypothetical protein
MLAKNRLFRFSKIILLVATEGLLLLVMIIGGTVSLTATLEYCGAIATQEMKSPARPYTQADFRRFLGFLLVAATPPALIIWILGVSMIRVGKQIGRDLESR